MLIKEATKPFINLHKKREENTPEKAEESLKMTNELLDIQEEWIES